MMSDQGRTKPLGAATNEPNQFKALRYEDVRDGIPPVTVKAGSAPRTPVSSSPRAPYDPALPRPCTSPSPNARAASSAPHSPPDVKRDSAIAPSISTVTRTSYAESHSSAVTLGVAKEPSLPTIVVQDDEPVPVAERSRRSPFLKQRSQEKSTKSRSVSPPRSVQRHSSFKGIDSSIPSGFMEDINLEDLVSDKVGFSNRGSLLFGGKKMNPASESPKGLGLDGAVAQPQQNGISSPAGAGSAQRDEAAKSGLVTGKRKPSIQMLEAAIQGGRVLSAEEMTFSMKVRSMYEYGDEKAAQWAVPSSIGTPAATLTNGSVRAPNTEINIDEIVAARAADPPSTKHPALREPSPDIRASYVKQQNELAGGIEDWDDVNVEDIDRYGFISSRNNNRNSVIAGGPGEGMQRVATSLRVEADQPRRTRKLHRGPSSATRSSRSLPPQAAQDVSGASVRSFQSNKSSSHASSGNPFRSRNRRTVAEASDMLTLPPNLEDIHEQEDAGRTASLLKRREWAREQKWQKMAKPTAGLSGTKGAGMKFTFDTTDPKVISRTWKGIPDSWRATAWHCYLSASAKKRGAHATDEELIAAFHTLQEQGSADDVQIDMDVPRTISMHIMFRRRYRGGQRLLFHVLHAISLYFPDTGYVQGMASLAATLLCYFDEEQAFVMMVRLWQLRGLEQLYRSGFEGLMAALKEFEDDWLARGAVAQKLDELGITSTAYGTRWYLTLFNMSVPFPAQLRVWDVFMLLGDAGPGASTAFGGADLDVLHATSAALIDATREIVLDSDFENAMKVLTSFVPIRDEDLLMRVAKVEWKMRKKRGGGGKGL